MGSGHPSLVPDLRGSFQLFTIHYDVNCGLVIYDPCYVEVHSFYTY